MDPVRDHIPVQRIRIDGGTQPRTAISESVVNDYADAMHAGTELPSVVMFFDGVDYWLADGFHRYHAAMKLGKDRLTCDLYMGTRRDAVLFSCGANSGHGLRRTNEDKRKAVATLLSDDEWKQWSNKEIARRCGVNPSLVDDMRRASLPSNGSEAHARTYTTRHGTEATMHVENIGKKPGAQPDRSKEAVAQRRKDIRDMAERGYSSRQIASALDISEAVTKKIAQAEGVAIHADRVIGKSPRHNTNRIIEAIVMDAENLTEGVTLIDFSDVDRTQLVKWLESLKSSRDKLTAFIRLLMKEQQKHGEAA